MGKTRKTKKIGLKKILAKTDMRLKANQEAAAEEKKKKGAVRNLQKHSASLFFAYNTQLGPPYHVLVDTNFINFAIKNKLDLVRAMM
ncbi:FCF1, partial [Symbiodinium sp. KB8]